MIFKATESASNEEQRIYKPISGIRTGPVGLDLTKFWRPNSL